MLRKAQQVGLKITVNNQKRAVSSISEIGKAFKNDDSIECAVKINKILNESFDKNGVYSYYCENKVMNKLRLKYIEEENNDKDIDSIARMVARREYDLRRPLINGCRTLIRRRFGKSERWMRLRKTLLEVANRYLFSERIHGSQRTAVSWIRIMGRMRNR